MLVFCPWHWALICWKFYRSRLVTPSKLSPESTHFHEEVRATISHKHLLKIRSPRAKARYIKNRGNLTNPTIPGWHRTNLARCPVDVWPASCFSRICCVGPHCLQVPRENGGAYHLHQQLPVTHTSCKQPSDRPSFFSLLAQDFLRSHGFFPARSRPSACPPTIVSPESSAALNNHQGEIMQRRTTGGLRPARTQTWAPSREPEQGSYYTRTSHDFHTQD